jgi:hypothetical protein
MKRLTILRIRSRVDRLHECLYRREYQAVLDYERAAQSTRLKRLSTRCNVTLARFSRARRSEQRFAALRGPGISSAAWFERLVERYEAAREPLPQYELVIECADGPLPEVCHTPTFQEIIAKIASNSQEVLDALYASLKEPDPDAPAGENPYYQMIAHFLSVEMQQAGIALSALQRCWLRPQIVR